ncbi:cytochrome P450 [Imleria badia]|nr:cytochrome P450 [Imleria badia]
MEWPTVASQPSAFQLAVLILAAIVTVDIVRRFSRGCIEKKGYPLPPGPTPLPVLGSALSIRNPQEPWLTYTAWRPKYGDLMYVRLLDTDVVVLNSRAVATDMLEKRSQIYSDRPFIAILEAYGHEPNFGFARYGPHWRLCRRIIHQTFRPEAALSFRPMQLRRARQIVINIIDDPNQYPLHYSTFSAAVAMSAVYDYEPQTREDPMVKIVADFCEASFLALIAEKAVLVKAFPFLLSVPRWIPGLSWIRREASTAYDLGTKAVEVPYQLVQKRMFLLPDAKEDIVADTMVFDHLQRMEKIDGPQRAEYEKALKHASSTAFIGAAESTSSTLMSFTLAMVKNPRVWKRAQAEIDALIGTERLPEYEHRPCLPYVEAIIRESLRWKPVAPIAPHAAIRDDVYKGYHIPRGATVIANIWAMTRDETRYPDPEAFIPERFLDSEGMLIEDDPSEFVFGFGRRICPGRYSADATIWSGIATMLATLDFNAVKDADGNDIEFEAKFASGIS